MSGSDEARTSYRQQYKAASDNKKRINRRAQAGKHGERKETTNPVQNKSN